MQRFQMFQCMNTTAKSIIFYPCVTSVIQKNSSEYWVVAKSKRWTIIWLHTYQRESRVFENTFSHSLNTKEQALKSMAMHKETFLFACFFFIQVICH